MLEKDTELRFSKISEILSHPWLKNTSMTDVMAKALEPPFKTDMFECNFDNSDFEKD